MTDMNDNRFDHYAGRKHGHKHGHHTPAAGGEEGPPSEYEIMSRAMQELLEAKGIVTAEEVRRRMEIFEEESDAWDVVVTDQTMSGLTGLELARRMLARRPDLPIVLCTGFSETANEETARAAGIAAFLAKPVEPEMLARTVRAVLDRPVAASARPTASRPVPETV